VLQIDDCRTPADRRKVALMPIAKRRSGRRAASARGDDFADIPSHLLRGRRKARNDAIGRKDDVRGVADHEYIRRALQR